MIYGRGRGAHAESIQVPRLIDARREVRRAAPRRARREHLVQRAHRRSRLVVPARLDKAPAGAFYYAENGENSYRELAEAIGRMLGLGGRTLPMPIDEAVAELGESGAQFSFG